MVNIMASITYNCIHRKKTQGGCELKSPGCEVTFIFYKLFIHQREHHHKGVTRAQIIW